MAECSAETAGLSVTFTDLSTDLDGARIFWDWQFGEGSVSLDRSPTPTYLTSGIYSVTLTVVDNYGAVGSGVPALLFIWLPRSIGGLGSPEPSTGFFFLGPHLPTV
ncbi:MAG: PKD domain-containing protein [Longimicrobiales bacterium]